MINLYESIIRHFLFRFDPETAHKLSIKFMGILPSKSPPKIKPVKIAGIDFHNPIGVAAGLDKNADAISGFFRLGFGYVEVGTVTPFPQHGNKKPRVFRITEQNAIINRFGFNNKGHDFVYERIKRFRTCSHKGIIGVNLGANKSSEDKIEDYIIGIQRFSDVADYLTLNISSPNTPGLRDLQFHDRLSVFLSRVLESRDKLTKSVPLFLKIAPDIDKNEIESISDVLFKNPVDALIVSNTSVDRKCVSGFNKSFEIGGLSGQPIEGLTTECLRSFNTCLLDKIPLIGVGGIMSSVDMMRKFKAGAKLVQIHTGLIYKGPALVRELLSSLNTKNEFSS